MTTQTGTQKLIATQIATMTAVEADSENKLPERIHLLRVGKFPTEKYGMLEITASDLQDFARNFKAGHGRPGPDGAKGGLPVNASHNKGGAAAAWVNDLEVEGNDLWGTKLEWTGFGKAEVEAGNFKYISSEFTPRCLGGAWASAEGLVKDIVNVFTGAALTNIPMFNGNKGILASAESEETGDNKQTIYINAHEEQGMNIDQLRVKNKSDLTAEELTFVQANAASLSEAEKTKFEINAAADNQPQTVEASAVTADMGVVNVEASEIITLRDRATAAEAKVEAAESAKSDLQKTVDAHAETLKNMAKKEVEAKVDTHIARGAIVADQKDKWVGLIMADASMEETLTAIKGDKVVDAGSLGGADNSQGGVTAAQQVDVEAKKLVEAAAVKGETLSIGDAYGQVFAANTDLAAKYQEESKVQ